MDREYLDRLLVFASFTFTEEADKLFVPVAQTPSQ